MLLSFRGSSWRRVYFFDNAYVFPPTFGNTSTGTDGFCLVAAYCLSLINTFVSFGLLLLHTPAFGVWQWNPPFHAPKIVICAFFLSNLFLVLVPFIPPSAGSRVYEQLPYWVSSIFLNLAFDIYSN